MPTARKGSQADGKRPSAQRAFPVVTVEFLKRCWIGGDVNLAVDQVSDESTQKIFSSIDDDHDTETARGRIAHVQRNMVAIATAGLLIGKALQRIFLPAGDQPSALIPMYKNQGQELFRSTLYSSVLSVVPLTMQFEARGWDLYIDSKFQIEQFVFRYDS